MIVRAAVTAVADSVVDAVGAVSVLSIVVVVHSCRGLCLVCLRNEVMKVCWIARFKLSFSNDVGEAAQAIDSKYLSAIVRIEADGEAVAEAIET